MAQEGYTAPFVLQDILTQKRAAQHQKLVDSLNLVQAQAEMENQVKKQAQDAEDARALAQYRTDTLAGQAADRATQEKIAGMPPRTLPTSVVQEYEYAKANGYKGSFEQYQNEDANRKKVTAPSNRYQYAGTDPATGKPITMDVLTGTFRISDAGPIGAKPSAAGAGGPSPAEFSKLAELRGKATTGPPRMLGMRAGKEPDPKAVAAYQQQRDNIITRYKASPAIVDAVMNALEEDPSVPVSEIISDVEASGATPEELAKFKEMLTIAGRR